MESRSEDRYGKYHIKFPIRNKILILSAATALPFVILVIYLLISMAQYSKTYDELVAGMTVANNYNLNFKEEMDESLYKLVVGYVTFDNISEDETLKDPYAMIGELRSEFTKLMDSTTETESRFWLQSLLRNIDTLEDRVDDIRRSLEVGEQYDQNIEELDNNIYILTELIQDDIQYFIYYQTRSMEHVSATLNQQVNRFIVVCSILIIILLAAVTVMTLFLSSGILRPIRKLYDATMQVAEGDFETRAPVDSNDEIAVLALGFNDMAENMQGLIRKIKEDEGKMRRADLRLLQEQINPHFLYNTLDTIVWLIESNETEQAVDMVVTLSNFFRIVLSKGKEFITIREETEHIQSYLEIQQVRYHDIMEYDMRIDEAIYDYRIPKLTLQPIVENALYHGIKYKRAKGSIHVNGERDGDKIYLTVQDDGVGMDEEELVQIREEISRPCKETEKGFGLANVNERIRMYYGSEYGMSIESEKGRGTIVELVIPADRKEKENEA